MKTELHQLLLTAKCPVLLCFNNKYSTSIHTRTRVLSLTLSLPTPCSYCNKTKKICTMPIECLLGAKKRQNSLGIKCGECGRWGKTSNFKFRICFVVWQVVWRHVFSCCRHARRLQITELCSHCWLKLILKHITVHFTIHCLSFRFLLNDSWTP
jgi:hypothetical protein